MAKSTQLSDAFKAVGESMVKLGKLLAEKEANTEVPATKKRVKRDVNAPKKNYSSYLHYCSLHRERIMKANPGLGQPAVAKLLGEEWNKLSEDEKEPYKKSADADKERYDKEMANYTHAPAHTSAEEDNDEEKQDHDVTPPAKKKKTRTTKPKKETVPAPVAEPVEAPTESEGDDEEKKAAEKKEAKKAKKAKKSKKDKK